MSLFAVVNGGSQNEKCKASKCSKYGPDIRFPFRLKHQPDHCGYPGFELSCSQDDRTILELPAYPGKFSVENIDYISQQIYVRYIAGCLERQHLNHDLSASPFWSLLNDISISISFFSCSESKNSGFFPKPIPCSFLSRNPVYAIESSRALDYCVDLSSCRKVSNATLPHHILYESDVLEWRIPNCGDCEANGKVCQRKEGNSSEPEIQCVHNLAKGALVDGMVLTEVIFGFLHFSVGIIIIWIVYRSNKLKREHRINVQKFLENYRALRPSRYTYADIKKITSNFKDKLGQGAYGIVYKGKISDEVSVAIKILDDSKGNGEEFINEIGTMSRIHHVNVVRLLGFCADGYKRALIYEYLSNESLDKFIFYRSGDNRSLDWHKLQDIAISIAKGIEYLHQGCDQRILHLDIKPHNILLDHNMNPKISDFGLAKLCSKEQSAISITAGRGTMGYIAPEMLSRNFGNVSYKSDVYSFGMVLIEMVGGRKDIDTIDNQTYFPEWLYNHLDQEHEVRIRIEEEKDIKIATKLSIIGLWCIQWYPKDRPSMKDVVAMLEGDEGKLIMPPNPFATMRQTPTNVRAHKTSMQPDMELTVISEIEEIE